MSKFDPKSIKLNNIHVMKNSDKGWHASVVEQASNSVTRSISTSFHTMPARNKEPWENKYHCKCIFTTPDDL